MTEEMALAKAKKYLAELAWSAFSGMVLGVGLAFGWWLVS